MGGNCIGISRKSVDFPFYSKCTLTKDSFVDVLLHFDTVSEVFPKGLKAWVSCGVVFDWCFLSQYMWCVHRCSSDGVRYPCWSWSGEQLAHVLCSHSSFIVVSHQIFLLIMTWGDCFGGLALRKLLNHILLQVSLFDDPWRILIFIKHWPLFAN